MLDTGFNFYCPIEPLSKAIDENGEEIMLLGGIASTIDEDADGEFLDPRGFDIKPLLDRGFVNWHHQAKTNPGTIVGEPTKAEIRKDGLYIETRLYPSSQVAQDIWNLANTLNRDSHTRRLGYSIEGRVLERGSDDASSPDYKHVTKAVITGVAITHMPKNPKTFANIIKGEIDDIEEDTKDNNVEEVLEDPTNSSVLITEQDLRQAEEEYYRGTNMKEQKSLSTDAGRPLIHESVNPKIKIVTFGKAQIMERLFSNIPAISINKAEKICNLIQDIATMAKRNYVTEEDIAKAYEALGLSPDYFGPNYFNPDVNDNKKDDDEEEEEKDKNKDAKKGCGDSDNDNNLSKTNKEENTDADNDSNEEDNVAVKAFLCNHFNRIEKAMSRSYLDQTKYVKALAVMVKQGNTDLNKAIDALEAANEKINTQQEMIKAQADEISVLNKKIDAFGSYTPAPKSLRHAAPVERKFDKATADELNQGSSRQVSITNKALIGEILDQASFAKGGYDKEFGDAAIAYEATGTIKADIRKRLSDEFGYTII